MPTIPRSLCLPILAAALAACGGGRPEPARGTDQAVARGARDREQQHRRRPPCGGDRDGAHRGERCEDRDDDRCEPGERGCGPAPTHTVGGSAMGLIGSGLVLRNNGADDLAIAASGPFTFATPLGSGAAYDVTVAAQPGNPAQVCTVAGGSGLVGAADVTGVLVTCASPPPPPPAGGTADPGFGAGGKVTTDFSGPPPAVLPPLRVR